MLLRTKSPIFQIFQIFSYYNLTVNMYGIFGSKSATVFLISVGVYQRLIFDFDGHMRSWGKIRMSELNIAANSSHMGSAVIRRGGGGLE
jgi:hypothetical protein